MCGIGCSSVCFVLLGKEPVRWTASFLWSDECCPGRRTQGHSRCVTATSKLFKALEAHFAYPPQGQGTHSFFYYWQTHSLNLLARTSQPRLCVATLLSGNLYQKWEAFKVRETHSLDFFFNNFIYLLTVLGLRCRMDISLVALSRGYSLLSVRRLHIAVASLIVERGGFSSCGLRAL